MAADPQGALHMVDVDELERQFKTDASPQVYIPLGEAYLRRGFPFKAIAVAQRGLKGDDSLTGRLLLAKAYFDASAIKRSYLKKAADEVDSIVNSDPNAWEGFRLKGEIALERDDLQEAIQALQQAHALNPGHPQARMLLKSLNIEVQDQTTGDGPFYVNVDTDFTPPRTDSLVKTFRDIFIILAIALGCISYLAGVSIDEKRLHGMIFLGRSQQLLDTYKGLKRAKSVYTITRKKLAPNDPFSMIHLAETHYALYQRHEHTKENLDKFKSLFAEVQRKGPKSLLAILPEYHALLVAAEYESALEMIRKGDRAQAESKLKDLDAYLKKYKVDLPIHVRLNWVHGLVYESLGKNRYAKAQFKRAAEVGWDSVFYRWRLAYYHLRQREFAAAHTQFAKATEQAKQNVNLVKGTLSAPDKQKNEYCWIDPPLILGNSAPPGLQLGTIDLLTEAFVAALRSDKLSNCPFNSAIQKKMAASPYYLLAPIGDAISVLDAGVGMSVGFKMIRELEDKMKKVKKIGNLSPHIDGWYNYAQAKGAYYRGDYKAALAFIEKAEKLAPYEAYIQSLYGIILFKMDKWDDGMARVKKAIKADPLLMQPYYESADALLNATSKGDDDDDEEKPSQSKRAEEVLDLMKKAFKDHSDYYYLLGRLQFNQDKKKEAEETWKKALDDQKAPYYGDHYESNLAMGKLWMNRAAGVPKDKKWKKDDYEGLHEQFTKYLKKIFKKIDDRVTKKKDNDEIKADYKKFLEELKEGRGKRLRKKVLNLRVGDLREVYFESAGSFFQASMQTRPGAVEPRLFTGDIYFTNGSYADSTGHYTIAGKGYLRDLDYKGAQKSYTRLARAIAFRTYGAEELKKRKTWKRIRRKKRKQAGEEVVKFFRQQADITLRGPLVKLQTTKKKKADKHDKEHLVKTVELIAKVLEEHKESIIDKKAIEELEEDAKLVKEKGLIAWGKVYKRRLAEKMKEMMKKARRGRRRR